MNVQNKTKRLKKYQQIQQKYTYVVFEDLLSCLFHVQPCVISAVNVSKHVRIRRLIVIALVTLAGRFRPLARLWTTCMCE